MEIDHKPALEVFDEYFGYSKLPEDMTNEEELGIIIGINAIKVIEENGATSLKTPTGSNVENKSLLFYCSVPVGTKFKFCNNQQIEIADNLVARMKEMKDNNIELDCLLITSCVSRQLALGPFFKKEVKQLFEIWNKPMLGFLSGGEIGNVQESNISYFHNVTCVLTGFRLK